MNYDKTCQLLIIGDSSVGKTSLITRYTNGTFKEEYLATVGLDYNSKDEVFNNETIHIKLWDTAGQERFKSLAKTYYRKAYGILLLFDITKRSSFISCKHYLEEVRLKDLITPEMVNRNWDILYQTRA